MRWVGALALFVSLLAGTAPARAATAATVDDLCYATIGGAPEVGVRVCRGGEQLKRVVADKCRIVGQGDTCALIDGRAIGAAHINAYEKSWVHKALSLQRALDDNVALSRSLLPHTHNSFNSPVYAPPTLTNQDPNQVYSLTDQLRMDMRAIELDVHWAPSLYGNKATGYKAVTLCHGQVQAGVHIGCSIDRPLRNGLTEIKAWLERHENRNEFVLLYLENNLDDDPTAHRLVADELRRTLGNLVARPPAGKPCAPIDTSVTPARLRADGHRVLIVGNCGPGAWGTWVHERGDARTWVESGSSEGNDYRCTPHKGTELIRWYEDSTWLSAMVDGHRSQLTTTEASAMANCGVNLIGFDQLVPEDPRLAAIVWSWAPNEPKAGGCVTTRADGRWVTEPCATSRPLACSKGPSQWTVAAVCDKGFRFDVPRNGRENALLRAAAQGRSVRLNYPR